MRLDGQIVVITGGAGLIGRALARAIVSAGGRAVIADIDPKSGLSRFERDEVDIPSGHLEFLTLDITSKHSLQSAISILHTKFGKVDALVNAAYPRNPRYGRKLEEVTYEDFCENVSLHLGGYFLATQQFVEYFRKQQYGSVINIASIYGVVAPRFSIYEGTTITMPVEYAAIKSAIIHLTRYFAQYLKGANIRVNSISPGGILDGQPDSFLARYNSFSASKGMLAPEDLQGVVVFLLSDMSRYINGQNIVVDDGWTL